ncbi:MAG: FAD-binding oxidoreductase [Thalassobaculales bacterium]
MDIDGFRKALGEVPVIDEPALVKQKSRDFFWYSPILKAELTGKYAALVVCPRHEADVVAVAAAAARHRVPLTPRGAGTGNYGQAVPLAGGAVLDMTGMATCHALVDGVATLDAGVRLIDIDRWARPQGFELRMYPSTKRSATIAGFVAGGSGGIGSIQWGGLREPGNVNAARVVTVEENPRVLDLVGDETNMVNHTYGTTGIITRLDIALAPAMAWLDRVVSFADLASATRFGQALAAADGIAKKLCSIVDWPIPQHFREIAGRLEPGRPIAICMVAPMSLPAFADLVRSHGGRVDAEQDAVAAEMDPAATPFYEYTWNHTTLQVLKKDKGITYLQSLFPVGRNVEMVEFMAARYGEEVKLHLEFIRFAGAVTCSALQIVRYTTPERLKDIIDDHEAHDVWIANPHVYTLEDGTRHKRLPGDQLGFKRGVDPLGLLNPGKMRSFSP